MIGPQLDSDRPSEPPARPVQTDGGLSLRWLLTLGFGGVLLLLLMSGFALTQRLASASEQGSAIRGRFLDNDRRLATISSETLGSSVRLRDALLDPTALAGTAAALLQSRSDVEQALDGYDLREGNTEEGEVWGQLEALLDGYWAAVMPFVTQTPDGAAIANLRLNAEVVPKRTAIMRILDRIHSLNEIGFRDEQSEITALRAGLRGQIWQMTGAACTMGFVIAFLATRQAGRLEARIRDQHAQDIVQRQALQQLSIKLMAAQEDERRRIARELHDEIGQALGAIKLELAVAERRLDGPQGAALTEARAITDTALESVRELSRLLHPSMLDDLGLTDTTATYLQHFTRRTGVRTDFHVAGLEARVPPDLEVCAYRVVQEAVTNVGRHAAATACDVRLERRQDALHVTVKDDGVGFTPVTLNSAQHFGLGLISLRERVSGLGGALEVTSATGQGTCVTAVLPLVPSHA